MSPPPLGGEGARFEISPPMQNSPWITLVNFAKYHATCLSRQTYNILVIIIDHFLAVNQLTTHCRLSLLRIRNNEKFKFSIFHSCFLKILFQVLDEHTHLRTYQSFLSLPVKHLIDPIGHYWVWDFNPQAKNTLLSVRFHFFYTCIEIYVQLAKIKKKKKIFLERA